MNTAHLVTGLSVLLSVTTHLASQTALAPPLRVPLHVAGDGAIWAAGRDYKVAFDSTGMTFYPALGEAAPTNLPLRWQTRSVGVPGQPPLAMAATAGATASGGARGPFTYEITRGDVVERYLVRDDGVEQQFAIAAPLQGMATHDLVVRGTVAGPLAAADRASAHAPITFCDSLGRAVVEYGVAFAIDAAGARCNLLTAVVDGEVEIRVPASWLATAQWPILIDPVTSRSATLVGATPASLPSVARDDGNNRVLISSARASAAGDWDLFVHVLNDAFAAPVLIYSDVTADSVRASAAVYAPQPQRWLVAMEVQQAAAWRVRVYFHDAVNLGFNTGVAANTILIAGQHFSTPALGASATSPYAALVCRRDLNAAGPINTDRSEATLLLVDTAARSLGSPTTLSFVSGQTYDAERPSITPVSDGDGWLVAWQEWDPAGTTVWDVIGRRISNGGSLVGGRALLLGGSDHELTPFVAGSGGRYLLSAVRRPRGDGSQTTSLLGDRVVTRRLTWNVTAPSPMLQAAVQLDSSAPSSSVQLGFGRQPIAFDHRTASHWSVAWKRDDLDSLGIARLGFDGAFVEKTLLEPPAPFGTAFFSPALCYDADGAGVIAVYTSQGFAAGDPLYARRFTHNLTAAAPTYGAGCAGAAQAFNHQAGAQPWRGSEFFGIALQGGRPNAPTWLMAAAGPGAIPMPSGGPGCTVLLDAATLLPPVAWGASDALGAWSVGLSLPSILAAQTAYWQFVQLDGGLLYGSAGLQTVFR